MAKLHQYSEGSGFYIKNSFRKDQRLIHVTYQLTPRAEKILMDRNYRDGAIIEEELMQELLQGDLIYTGGTGAKSEEIEGAPPHAHEDLSKMKNREDVFNELPDDPSEKSKRTHFSGSAYYYEKLEEGNTSIDKVLVSSEVLLSQSAVKWCQNVLRAHPLVQEEWRKVDGRTHEQELITPKELRQFHKQLECIAMMMDGTDFFKEIETCYVSEKWFPLFHRKMNKIKK